MQELTAKRIECAEEGKVSYEINWEIPNWRQVRHDFSILKDQRGTFETGSESVQMVQTKWLVGLNDATGEIDDEEVSRVILNWQLLDLKGVNVDTKLDVRLSTQLYWARGVSEWKDVQFGQMGLYQINEGQSGYLDIGAAVTSEDDDFINDDGSVNYLLVLTFKIPNADPADLYKLMMQKFYDESDNLHCENFAKLLNEESGETLKIITSEGTQLLAYPNILKAQCPIFAAMMNSNFSESQTGIVKITDICEKTMRILLNYFYTGKLLQGWTDRDTILEFTYAANKYQIQPIILLCDRYLGNCDKDPVSYLDVQLLRLSSMMSLKNAEERLFKRVVSMVWISKSSSQLFGLFGWDKEQVDKNSSMINCETAKFKVLEILDYDICNVKEMVQIPRHGLRLLSFLQIDGPCKILEQKFLRRLVETTRELKTAEELFRLFENDE